jgi:hypothetical protein
MNGFWKNWLTIWAWGVIFFGAILALFVFPAIEGPSRLFYALIQKPVPAQPDAFFRFAMGLIGCITMGWGLTMLACFKAAWMMDPDKAKGIWRSFTAAVFFWFVTDSVASVYTGFSFNAVSNTVLIGLYIIPIWRSGVLKG